MSHNFMINTIRRSLLAGMLFPALLLAVCLLLYRQLPLTSRLHPVSMTMYDDFKVQGQTDARYVSIDTAPRLLYDTGILQDRGAFPSKQYYYTFLDGRGQLYLLTPQESEKIRLTGHLAALDDVTYRKIAAALADAIGWDVDSLQDFLSPYYFVSEPLFDGKQMLFYLVLLSCCAAACLDLMRSACYFLLPWKLPFFRRYGSQEGKKLLQQADGDLKQSMPVHRQRMYLTSRYLISLDAVKTMAVPLADISQMYCRPAKGLGIGRKAAERYTLFLVLSNGKRLRIDGKKKEAALAIIQSWKE